MSHLLALLLAPAAPPDFARDVAPLLERSCIRCHSGANVKGGVSLASPDGWEPSDLLDQVAHPADGSRPLMPKEGRPLSEAEVATLRAWVAAGAKWPAGVTLREKSKADRS